VTSRPLRSVAADSNVLLAALAGRAAKRVFDHAPELLLVTTEETIAEVEEYLPEFAARYGLDLEMMREALGVLPVERYAESDYISHVSEARRYLATRDADDVALAALALKLGVPIWSNDKDFEELPLDVYPTAKLLKILGI
jgi:predicted nucleic acid-binding protein